MNIGILLAAGKSSRFDSPIPKQLYHINGKNMISHSVDAMSGFLDETVIITNTVCHKKIIELFPKTTVLINDVDCRLASIKTALDHMTNKKVTNIIIHDSARPFITKKHIEELLLSSQTYKYSQYCLKLTNGLVRKNEKHYEVVNREEYIELCTPLICNYKLFDILFRNFIYEDRVTCEIIPLLDLLEIEYNLIEGNHKHLRKITTIDDL